MDKTQFMSSATAISLLGNKREEFLVSQSELWNADLARASGEPGVLDEQVRLHVAHNVVRFTLGQSYVVLQVKCHHLVHDALDEVDE